MLGVLAVLAFAVAGCAAGAAARLLLRRMPRGVRVRGPGCELATGAAWALAAGLWVAGLLPISWLAALLGLGWLAVAASAADLAHRRLPDTLTLPALPAALLLSLPHGPAVLVRAVVGAAVLAGVHAAVRLAAPRAMGGGDVKLAAPLGALLAAASWLALPGWAVLAAVLTALGAAVSAATGHDHRAGLPHGVSMLAAAWLVLACAAGLGTPG